VPDDKRETPVDQFAASWRAGTSPSIRDALSDHLRQQHSADHAETSRVLTELIKIDMRYRCQPPVVGRESDRDSPPTVRVESPPQLESYLHQFADGSATLFL